MSYPRNVIDLNDLNGALLDLFGFLCCEALMIGDHRNGSRVKIQYI